jgi:hypothetical protein
MTHGGISLRSGGREQCTCEEKDEPCEGLEEGHIPFVNIGLYLLALYSLSRACKLSITQSDNKELELQLYLARFNETSVNPECL